MVLHDLGGASGKEAACQHRRLRETQVQSLVQKDPLEEDMATPFSILSGESHDQRSLVGYSP